LEMSGLMGSSSREGGDIPTAATNETLEETLTMEEPRTLTEEMES
jgi:hypothetical protein